jgi:hypothetical protein
MNLSEAVKKYTDILRYYQNYKKRRLLLYYEDLIENPKETIRFIHEFLSNDNMEESSEKVKELLNLYEELFQACAMASNRDWNGYESAKETKFHFPMIQNHEEKEAVQQIINTFVKNDASIYPLVSRYF